MSRRYDLFIFDWDGTMMQTTDAIVESILFATRHMGYPVPSVELTRSAIGLGRVDTMKRLVPACPPQRWEDFESLYREHYLALEQSIPLVPGMRDLLLKIKSLGGINAIATGKSERGLKRVLAATGTAELFDDYRVGAFSNTKPAPQMVLELCERFGVALSKAVVIGDSTLDLEMAANAHVDACGVTYGACTREALARCPNCGLAENVAALTRLLLE